MRVVVRGAEVKVEYRLHKDDFRDPDDPDGDSINLFCLHLPQIAQTYIDKTEELVFEALEEFFEQDLIRFYAHKLVKEREERDQ
jgi:hypothetical protein